MIIFDLDKYYKVNLLQKSNKKPLKNNETVLSDLSSFSEDK